MHGIVATHQYWLRRVALLAVLFVFSRTLAQSTLYKLETGSFTPANGPPALLLGTFEWGPERVVYSPNIGEDIIERDMIGLHFSTDDNTSFRLNTAPGNLCSARLTPNGLSGFIWSFCAVVDAYGSNGVLTEPAVRIVTETIGGTSDANRIVYPSLYLYRNYNSATEEIIGRMEFSAIPVPESSSAALVTIGILAALAIFRNRAPSR